MVTELKKVVDPQLNKSKHDFTPVPSAGATGQTGQAMLDNCKDKGKREKLRRIPVLGYLSSSICASLAQTLVNTVNVVWLGGGIFKLSKKETILSNGQ